MHPIRNTQTPYQQHPNTLSEAPVSSHRTFEAKNRFSDLIDRVGRGAEVTITKHDKPVARIVPATDQLRERRKRAVAELRALRGRYRLKSATARELIGEGRPMSEFVWDCSAALPWVFANEATPATEALLDDWAGGGHAWVPALWHLELANVMLGAQRRGQIDKAGAKKFLSTLRAVDIEVDDETISVAWTEDPRAGRNLWTNRLRRGLPRVRLAQRRTPWRLSIKN